jgi:hypothetical protein
MDGAPPANGCASENKAARGDATVSAGEGRPRRDDQSDGAAGAETAADRPRITVSIRAQYRRKTRHDSFESRLA